MAPNGHSEFVLSFRSSKKEHRETINVDQAILAAGDHHGSTYYQHQRFFNMIRDGGDA
jgi:myo-inositol 2-dehydrogenase/D-chiro-inositol 1-dehydrogenase